MADGDLAGRMAMVTGGASGIGRACARRLIEAGAAVAIADLDAQGGTRVVGDLGPQAFFVALDVTDEDAWPVAMAAVAARWDRLDIMVNAAGVAEVAHPFEVFPTAEWRRVLAVNLEGTFLGCKHAVLAMKANGGGAIVNISSVLAQTADGDLPAYCASKGGVTQLTRTVALHCGRKGYAIRCNAVHPGYIRTPIIADLLAPTDEARRALAATVARHPLGRLGEPEEVAELVHYLAGDASSFATGAAFTIDGGYTLP